MAHLFDQPNTTEIRTWQEDSDLRGSMGILWICSITLLLGIWSAYHSNLPGSGNFRFETVLRKSGWILCGLFAPEVIVLVAWTQRKAANRVQRKIEERFGRKPSALENVESQRPTLKHRWTMTHSFWAIMGGIAVDVNGDEPLIKSNGPPKLTEKGIYLLIKLEPDLLPDISEDEVKDKSKADWLTKSLACIQATWFCVSCLVRVVQSLPMSLLELNTFSHAMCTIIVYFIWWKKPLDVERPLLITSDRLRPLLAFMWMSSKTSARPQPISSSNYTYKVSPNPEFDAIGIAKTVYTEQNTSESAPGTVSSSTIKVTSTSGLAGTGFFVNKDSARWVVEQHENSSDEHGPPPTTTIIHENPEFNLTAADQRRWRLAHDALAMYGLEKYGTDQGLVTVRPVPDMFESPPWAAKDSATYLSEIWAAFGFCLLTAAYGAFHALAWNTRFPTRRQKILWRVSSLIIASPAGVALLIVFLIIVHVFAMLVAQQFAPRRSGARKGGRGQPTMSSTASSKPTNGQRNEVPPTLFGEDILETKAWKAVVWTLKCFGHLTRMILVAFIYDGSVLSGACLYCWREFSNGLLLTTRSISGHTVGEVFPSSWLIDVICLDCGMQVHN